MKQTPLLLTGATGLTGQLLVERMGATAPEIPIVCITRSSENQATLDSLHPNLVYTMGDTAFSESWDRAFAEFAPQTLIHIVQLRQVPVILKSLHQAQQSPRLIIIGTTGVFSRYNHYSQEYQAMEALLQQYPGQYCLLRPTMIYGSPRDKNIHRLIRFCDRYPVFPVFGSGKNLLQPIHAEDLAKALFAVYQNPEIEGAYNLSGGTVVSFTELLALVSKVLGKSVRQISLPLYLGVWSATLSETILGRRSPVRREQILRLQEDKAFSHEAAQRDFGFSPRSLEVGLHQEVALMRQAGMISSILP